VKVLVLQSELGVLRGGGENFTRNLFAAFARRGHKITAAFIADRRGRYPIALPPGIEALPIPGWWSRDLGQNKLADIGRYFRRQTQFRTHWDHVQAAIHWRTIRWHNRRFQQRIEREFRDRWNEFDVVYVHSDPKLASNVAKYRPTILRLPGPITSEHATRLRAVHAVCANGDALIRIREFIGGHAIELPIGIDTRLFKPGPTPVRRALGWTEQHIVIGYVGQLTHLKGADLLATTIRKIACEAVGARFLIIGTGAEETYIRSTVAKELNRGLVRMEGDVSHENVNDWYRAMDLLVMPSRYENFSNAIIEGMACGVPFLAADVGGNRIMAKSGGGWLFEIGSISSLIASVSKILKSKEEMKRRGELGCRYVHKYCTWEQSANCLESIISSRLRIAA
jgi:glycosyltransferase involved in cell wall biosynthesis